MQPQTQTQLADLYNNMIEAQYAYFVLLEEIKTKEIMEKVQDRVRNPYHWSFKYSKTNCKHEKTESSSSSSSSAPTITLPYKKILLALHPDKNIKNSQEANVLYLFVQELISEKKTDELNLIGLADDIWKATSDLYKKQHLFVKEKFINKCMNSLWYCWEESMFITQKELDILNVELEKENEMLRTQIIDLQSKVAGDKSECTISK